MKKVVPLIIDSILIDELATGLASGMQVTLGTFLLALVLPEIVGVDSLLADETAISLSDSDEDCTLLDEEFAGPVSDVTETLDDKAFSLETLGDSQFAELLVIVEDLLGRVEDAQASSLLSATDTVVSYAFASSHTCVVDVTGAVELLILVFDESHLPLASADVGARHVDGRPETGFLAKRSGIVPGDAFDLTLGETARIDFDAALGTAIGESSDGVLDRHEAGESFDLLQVDVAGIARSALGGEAVSLVLNTIGFDHLDESGV